MLNIGKNLNFNGVCNLKCSHVPELDSNANKVRFGFICSNLRRPSCGGGTEGGGAGSFG